MDNKKIVFVTIIIITFIIIIVINFNRKSNDTQNKIDNSIQSGNKNFGYFLMKQIQYTQFMIKIQMKWCKLQWMKLC